MFLPCPLVRDHTPVESARFRCELPGGSSPPRGIRPVLGCVCLAVGSHSQAVGYARYTRVANDLRAAIVAGRFPPGTRLPSERALANEFGVSRATIVSAFHLIRGEGLIETQRGTGSWVARRP